MMTNKLSLAASFWITTPESFALFPVVVLPSGVLTYVIQRNDFSLSREFQENIVPGDYGIYNEDMKVHFVYKSRRDELQTLARWLEAQSALYFRPTTFLCRLGEIF